MSQRQFERLEDLCGKNIKLNYWVYFCNGKWSSFVTEYNIKEICMFKVIVRKYLSKYKYLGWNIEIL